MKGLQDGWSRARGALGAKCQLGEVGKGSSGTALETLLRS